MQASIRFTTQLIKVTGVTVTIIVHRNLHVVPFCSLTSASSLQNCSQSSNVLFYVDFDHQTHLHYYITVYNMHMVVDVNEMLISTERRLEYESFKVMLPV